VKVSISIDRLVVGGPPLTRARARAAGRLVAADLHRQLSPMRRVNRHVLADSLAAGVAAALEEERSP
jgi:hypothetical protein